jgi:hypothetical protein
MQIENNGNMLQKYKNKTEQLLQQHATHYSNMQIEAIQTHAATSQKSSATTTPFENLLQHPEKTITTCARAEPKSSPES